MRSKKKVLILRRFLVYGYGILGVAFVVFDESKAGIGGSLVLERELVKAY